MAAQNANTVANKFLSGLPAQGFPFSFNELAKELGRGPMRGFLTQIAKRDLCFQFFDFDTLVSSAITPYWTVAGGGGASQVNFTQNLQSNGILRGTTGTASGVTTQCSMIGPIFYNPATNPGMEIRFKVVTSALAIRAEFGFIDAIPATNTAAVNNFDTPTFFSANSVTAGWDTAATANKINLYAVGTATNQAAIKAVGTIAPAAVTVYQTVRIQLYSRDDTTAGAVDAAMWVDGQRMANLDTSATAGVGVVNAAVLLAPWVYFEATSGTSKSLDIDYIALWNQRIT